MQRSSVMYREWYAKPRDIRRDSFVDALFSIVNRQIDRVMEKHIKDGNLIDGLSRLYWDSWWGLKFVSGTSAGWPWFAEYAVFYVLRKHISEDIGVNEMIPLKPDRLTPASDKESSSYVWLFVDDPLAPRFVLAHNAYLARNIQPDITLHESGRLLFTVDVKVSTTSSESMADALSRITESVKRYGASGTQGYLVSLTRNLSFSADKIRLAFRNFKNSGCHVVAPTGGTLQVKMNDLGGQLMSLERCLDRIRELIR